MENILLQFGLNYIKTNLGTEEQRKDFLKNMEHIKEKLKKKIEEAEEEQKKKELTELPNLENIKKK